jgi:hypothetical protein
MRTLAEPPLEQELHESTTLPAIGIERLISSRVRRLVVATIGEDIYLCQRLGSANG